MNHYESYFIKVLIFNKTEAIYLLKEYIKSLTTIHTLLHKIYIYPFYVYMYKHIYFVCIFILLFRFYCPFYVFMCIICVSTFKSRLLKLKKK